MAVGKPDNPEKNPRNKARTSNKLSPPGGNQIQVTLLGERALSPRTHSPDYQNVVMIIQNFPQINVWHRGSVELVKN